MKRTEKTKPFYVLIKIDSNGKDFAETIVNPNLEDITRASIAIFVDPLQKISTIVKNRYGYAEYSSFAH